MLVLCAIVAAATFFGGIYIERFRQTTTSPVREGLLFSACFWATAAGLTIGVVGAGVTFAVGGITIGAFAADIGLGLASTVGGVLAGSGAQQLFWKLTGR
jgi:hypothetical protein